MKIFKYGVLWPDIKLKKFIGRENIKTILAAQINEPFEAQVFNGDDPPTWRKGEPGDYLVQSIWPDILGLLYIIKKEDFESSYQLVDNRKVRLFFAWYDFWIGCYWNIKDHTLYICPLPCVVISIKFK
jgi:hypothetical protein